VLAALNAWVFHNGGMYRRLAEWDRAAATPRAARVAGAASLVLWVAIIFSGRMIAYNWFDCDKPEPAIVNLLAGCVAENDQ
jgi:hypothetical protein